MIAWHIVATLCSQHRAVGIYTAGALALFGAHDLPVYIDAFKAAVPLLVYPTKLLVSFPFVYHTLAGIRHLVRDHSTFLFPLHPRSRLVEALGSPRHRLFIRVLCPCDVTVLGLHGQGTHPPRGLLLELRAHGRHGSAHARPHLLLDLIVSLMMTTDRRSFSSAFVVLLVVHDKRHTSIHCSAYS